jgi:hypothetical protein
LEDHRARDFDVPAMQEASPSAFRLQQLRILRRPSGDRPKGRGSGRIEFDHGAELIAAR